MSRRGIDCTALSSEYQAKFANDCFRVVTGLASPAHLGWKADIRDDTQQVLRTEVLFAIARNT